jgi:hypothetical protein
MTQQWEGNAISLDFLDQEIIGPKVVGKFGASAIKNDAN